MKKILFFICVLSLIGFHESFAQEPVDADFDLPTPYSQIPFKHVDQSGYTLNVNYSWSGPGFGNFGDTLDVTIDDTDFGDDTYDGTLWGADSLSHNDGWSAADPALLTDAINMDDATGSNPFLLVDGNVTYTITGAYRDGSATGAAGTITPLVFTVDVNSDTYARYDGGYDASQAVDGNGNGSIGAVFEAINDDYLESVEINFDGGSGEQFNISVFQLNSATSTTGTLVHTSPIQLVSLGGQEVTIGADLTGGEFYLVMVNQITSNAISVRAEDALDDGSVVRYDNSGDFEHTDEGDIAIYLYTQENTAPQFDRIPGDVITFYVDEAGSFDFNAVDAEGDAITLSLSDTLPSFNVDWLTFTDNGSGSGTISGTPDISNIGTITLEITADDGVSSDTYDNQHATLELRVINSVEFTLPFSEDFSIGTTPNNEIPANWTQIRDLDGEGDGDDPSWEESGDEMFIDESGDNTKQNEWLITAPIVLPALSASSDSTYTLEFYADFDDEDNFVGGSLSTLGSGTDGNGNFADLRVWIIDSSDTTEVWNDNDNAELIVDNNGTLDGNNKPEIDLTDYEGETIRVVFQYTSNNPNQNDADAIIDDVEISVNEEVDLSVIARAPNLEIPRSEAAATGGYDLEYYVINRGYSVPSDAELTVSVSSPDDDSFEDVFMQMTLDASDFDANGEFMGTVTINPSVPAIGDSYDYTIDVTISQDDNNPTGTDNDDNTITIDDSFVDFFGDDDDETANGVYDGLGEIFTLEGPGFVESVYVDWNSAGDEEFEVNFISVTADDDPDGTLVATLNDDDGDPLEASGGGVTYSVDNDEDFEDYLYLEAGTYVIMITPTDPDNNEFVIASSEDEFGRAAYGDFVRGNQDNLYRDADDDGDLDIRLNFIDNDKPEFYDPSDGDITTAINDITLSITAGVASDIDFVVIDPQAEDDVTVEQVTVPSVLDLPFVTVTNTAGGFNFAVDNTATEGEYAAQVLATDGLDTAYLDIELIIGANPAPVFTTSPTTIATVGNGYSYAATGEDPLGETVTASAVLTPSWLTATASGDTVTLSVDTIPASAEGYHAVKLQLQDASGNIAEQSFAIFVLANAAPKFTSFPVTYGEEGEAYEYRVTVTDEEGTGSIALSASTLPTGFAFSDEGNGVGLLTSTSLPVDTSSVVIEATDGVNTVSQSFDVIVNAANQAPTFTSTPDAIDSTAADTDYIYSISGTDPDGDALQFSAPVLPYWALLVNDGAGSARLIGDPRDADVGDHDVTIWLSDGKVNVPQSYVIRVTASGSIIVEDEDDVAQEEAAPNNGDDDAEIASLFPNPAINAVNIDVEKRMMVTLIDMSGNVVKTFKVNKYTTELSLTDVESGIYFVRFGDSEAMQKLIVK